MQGLTPYQGRKRTFGLFKCEKCNRSWRSGNSWADTSQKCRTCQSEVYPFKQRKPRGGPGPNPKKPHKWCEMCERIGEICTEFDRVSKDDFYRTNY